MWSCWLVGLCSWPCAVSNLCPVSTLWSPVGKEMQEGGSGLLGMNRAELGRAGASPRGRWLAQGVCPGCGWVRMDLPGRHSSWARGSCSATAPLRRQPRSSPSILQTFALRKAARSSASIDVDITTNRHLGTGKNWLTGFTSNTHNLIRCKL